MGALGHGVSFGDEIERSSVEGEGRAPLHTTARCHGFQRFSEEPAPCFLGKHLSELAQRLAFAFPALSSGGLLSPHYALRVEYRVRAQSRVRRDM
jgi:hypothetical protein